MKDHKAVLTDAIDNRLQVCFRYRGSDETETTVRVVEPWVYGYRNGKECLYGYQVSGGMVGARRFDLRAVGSIEMTGDPCDKHPDSFDLTKWDVVHAKHMPRITIQA